MSNHHFITWCTDNILFFFLSSSVYWPGGLLIPLLLDQEKASDIDDELLKVVPELDPVDPVGSQGQVGRQLGEGLRQALLVHGVRLAGDQVRHQLVVGVLKRIISVD